MERLCSNCGNMKNITDFSLNRNRRTHVCKQCQSDRVKVYQKNHPEQTKEARERWRQANKEKEFLETKATRLAVKYLKLACPDEYRKCIDRARAEVGLKPSRKSKDYNQQFVQLERQPL